MRGRFLLWRYRRAAPCGQREQPGLAFTLGEFSSQAVVFLMIAVLASAIVPVHLHAPASAGIVSLAGISVAPITIVMVIWFFLENAFRREKVSWKSLAAIYGALAAAGALLSVLYLAVPALQAPGLTSVWLAAFLCIANLFAASATVAVVVTGTAMVRPDFADSITFPFFVSAAAILSLLVFPAAVTL